MYILEWEVENIVRIHYYIGKHGWKVTGGSIHKVGICGFLISGMDSLG